MHRPVLACSFVVAGLVAACGDDDNSAPTPTVTSTTTVAASTTSTVATSTTATPAPTEEPTTTGVPVVRAAELGFNLPDGFTYPEGIALDPGTGRMYVTSTSGAIAVFEPGAETATVWSPAGDMGRTFALGIEFGHGSLWVASGPFLLEYAPDGEQIGWYATPDGAFLNDVAITDDGAYVTDPNGPWLWFVPFEPDARAQLAPAKLADVWPAIAGLGAPAEGLFLQKVDLSGSNPSPGTLGFNGVEALPDGSLVVGDFACCSLHHVDPRVPSYTPIDLGGYEFVVSDGMSLSGLDLWITQGMANGGRTDEVDRVRLCPTYDCGSVTPGSADPNLSFPTDVQVVGNKVYVVNSQFDNGGGLGDGTPTLPFTVSVIAA